MLIQCSKEPCEPISLSIEREAKSLVSKSLLQKKLDFTKNFSKIIKRINDIIFVFLKQ